MTPRPIVPHCNINLALAKLITVVKVIQRASKLLIDYDPLMTLFTKLHFRFVKKIILGPTISLVKRLVKWVYVFLVFFFRPFEIYFFYLFPTLFPKHEVNRNKGIPYIIAISFVHPFERLLVGR